MATFNTRIQMKYDTYDNWNTNNPVLYKGELAIVEIPDETGIFQTEPTYLLKVGDGINNFQSLNWISGTAADVYDWAKQASKPTYQASEIQGLEDFITGEIKDTNTKYQIIKENDMTFKLQSKEKDGLDWIDVNTISLVSPVYSLIEGEENGTLKFGILGSEQSVKVHGLGSAAYVETDTFDLAGTGASEANKIKNELIGEGSGLSQTIKGVYDESKTYTDQQIASKLGSVYKPQGSINFGDLPELGALIEGHVYNILDAFTTTEDFVEGASHKYPAGANIVCIDVGTDEFKWDVLSGAVDLSAYDTSAATQEKINAAKQEAISHADDLNSTMDGRVEALETKVGGSPVSDQITTAISGLKKEDSAVPNQFVTAVSQENGVISVTRAQPTIADITNLQSTLDEKAKDSDLHAVAKSGKIDDLTQTATIIFNCGTSSTIID